ncbi:diaminopimelate decarboxylase [Pseudanabaena sp. FACHB-2040]|uniref:diaminopimelate decarboxylase n=1 Tax=Pseudanabaena sp. FACHB-2040 TaxID=2692859 RepID=UPI001688D30E|nr:diaminopimelate decarboxylase [Pseudanabaena sp. FACHB-2040]MBD2260762.1 diaminopimelate decarboxylase [Pseudanabaena sp. FACHB-2040]
MVSTFPADVQNSSRQYLSGADSTSSPNQSLLPLTAQANAKDHLEVGGCDVVDLVQRFGSPLYVLDEHSLRTACRQYREAFARYYSGEALVLYASKAWNCLAVCAIAASEGLGIDVVSAGELYTALQAGVPANQIYFHGNNKSTEELQMAVDARCRIVVDNWFELRTLADLVAAQADPIEILLRLTPGIECHTHEYIRTGHLDSKFGFDPDQVEAVFEFLSQQPGLACLGIHAHIGSQIFELNPHTDLGDVMVQWLVKAQQYGLSLSELDVGGGLGIRYTESDDPPSIDTWVKTVCEGVIAACQAHQLPLPKLLCEPGRSLIGSACVTAYTVGSQKHIPGLRTYVSVDGGMSDNPRPITYQSVYRALAASRMSAPLSETLTLAGKHCESGDILIKDAQLPALETGEVVVIPATGAYNYSMASNYNRVPRPAAVLVNAGEAHLIIQRETLQDLLRQDCLPETLKP